MYRKATNNFDLEKKKRILWKQLEKSVYAWLYAKNQETIKDDLLVEKALIYRQFEDLNLLRELYSMSVLRRIWRERLVSQGEYYGIINWLLVQYQQPRQIFETLWKTKTGKKN